MTLITHVVLFEPKANISSEQITLTIAEAFDMKEQCLHPETKTPYVKSLVGGKGNMIDVINGSQGESTLVSIIDFANMEDRRFFVEKDEAQLGFIQRNIGYLAKAQVLPFCPGVFSDVDA